MNLEITNNMLSATNLQCVRGERLLFKDISFDLARGSLLYIEGANGSGKTTLLRSPMWAFNASFRQHMLEWC